jgi:hypothetical protein
VLVIFQGFSRDGIPVLTNFLKIKGAFQASPTAKILSPRTLLVHFRLADITDVVHFTMVQKLLEEHCADDRLRCIDLPISLGKDRQRALWPAHANKVLAPLSQIVFQQVIAVVTVPSDDDSGDLLLGKCEDNEPAALAVKDVCTSSLVFFDAKLIILHHFQWLDLVMSPFKLFLGGATMYFVSCGALVRNPESFQDLKDGVKR